jgi:Txe/YoeB family toxin of Txe-Axe toxin-antitoxin module
MKKAIGLLEILKEDPFKKPPAYEAQVGELEGAYSRRINKVIPMLTHYGE